jgi:hypothetical protein
MLFTHQQYLFGTYYITLYNNKLFQVVLTAAIHKKNNFSSSTNMARIKPSMAITNDTTNVIHNLDSIH